MDPKLLLSAVGILVMFILSLLVKLIWDNKKEIRDQKDCINTKKDKADCIREMDDVKKRID